MTQREDAYNQNAIVSASMRTQGPRAEGAVCSILSLGENQAGELTFWLLLFAFFLLLFPEGEKHNISGNVSSLLSLNSQWFTSKHLTWIKHTNNLTNYDNYGLTHRYHAPLCSSQSAWNRSRSEASPRESSVASHSPERQNPPEPSDEHQPHPQQQRRLPSHRPLSA